MNIADAKLFSQALAKADGVGIRIEKGSLGAVWTVLFQL